VPCPEPSGGAGARSHRSGVHPCARCPTHSRMPNCLGVGWTKRRWAAFKKLAEVCSIEVHRARRPVLIASVQHCLWPQLFI